MIGALGRLRLPFVAEVSPPGLDQRACYYGDGRATALGLENRARLLPPAERSRNTTAPTRARRVYP